MHVLSHKAINITVYHREGLDGSELIQATPHGHVLPKIHIKQILLGNFDHLCRGVRSGASQIVCMIKPGSIIQASKNISLEMPAHVL